MIERPLIHELIATEYSSTTKIGHNFDFLSSQIFHSLLTHPEKYTFTFDDFEKSYDISIEFTNQDQDSIDTTLKIFSALAIIFNHSTTISQLTLFEKWDFLFKGFYSLDLYAFLIKYNQSKHLDILYSFLSINPTIDYLFQNRSERFVKIFSPSFTPEQLSTFLNYTAKYLDHFFYSIEKISSNLHTLGINKLIEHLSFTYICFLTGEHTRIHDIGSHILYKQFISLPDTYLHSAYDDFCLFETVLLENVPLLKELFILVFAKPFFCSLAFKSNNQYFLPFCDVDSAIKTHPQYFF